MRETYDEAMQQVFADEGGYTNDPADSGGPTNWGITIHDARMYWKQDASAYDVRTMPKSVAEDIYRKHYASPIHYDDLPAGVDYAVLDYSINSGIGRGVPTWEKHKSLSPVDCINAIYDDRVAFLKGIVSARPSQSKFFKGWMERCARGRKLALALNAKYQKVKMDTAVKGGTAGGIVVAGSAVATTQPHLWPYILAGTVLVAIAAYLILHYKGKKNVS